MLDIFVSYMFNHNVIYFAEKGPIEVPYEGCVNLFSFRVFKMLHTSAFTYLMLLYCANCIVYYILNSLLYMRLQDTFGIITNTHTHVPQLNLTPSSH